MKMTLLDMTQNILSSLNSSEVNSYSDTTESLQVANIIQTTYYNMLSKYDLPENNQLFQLDSSTNADQPVLMYKPSTISRVEWIKYFDSNPSDGATSQHDQYGSYSHDLNLDITSSGSATTGVGPGYLEVHVESIEHFLKHTHRFNPEESNVGTMTITIDNQATGAPATFTFYYKNDAQPRYCTILSDRYVIFDSYDSTQDTTLQSSKTECFGWVQPNFILADTFIPALEDNMFPLLLNEAKSLAFLELKQMAHQKAEQEVQRQLSSLQKFKSAATKPTPFERLPNYGRYRNFY